MANVFRPDTLLAFVALMAVSLAAPNVAAAASERTDQLVRDAMKLDKHPERGARAYALNCAACHGSDGNGNATQAVPSLAGQRQAYLIKQFVDFSERERDSAPMHAVISQPRLRQAQAWADIAAYLNEREPLPSPETGTGKDLELGEAIFGEQCAACHEEDGRGDDDGFVPSLRNQHYSYIVRQVENLAQWHRRNVDEDFIRFLASFDETERMAVADYLSRLRGPTRDRTKLNDDGTAGD